MFTYIRITATECSVTLVTTITSLARELNPTGVRRHILSSIYIYIYIITIKSRSLHGFLWLSLSFTPFLSLSLSLFVSFIHHSRHVFLCLHIAVVWKFLLVGRHVCVKGFTKQHLLCVRPYFLAVFYMPYSFYLNDFRDGWKISSCRTCNDVEKVCLYPMSEPWLSSCLVFSGLISRQYLLIKGMWIAWNLRCHRTGMPSGLSFLWQLRMILNACMPPTINYKYDFISNLFWWKVR